MIQNMTPDQMQKIFDHSDLNIRSFEKLFPDGPEGDYDIPWKIVLRHTKKQTPAVLFDKAFERVFCTTVDINKKMAEFIGWKYNPGSTSPYHIKEEIVGWSERNKKETVRFKNTSRAKARTHHRLRFHKDWNRLHLVTKKCWDIMNTFEYGSEEYIHIERNIFNLDNTMSEMMNADIDSIYARCTDFIFWYEDYLTEKEKE